MHSVLSLSVVIFVKCWRYKQELSRLRGSLREREHYFTTTNEAYDIVVPTEGNIAYNTQPNTTPNGEYSNVLLYDTIPNSVSTGANPIPTGGSCVSPLTNYCTRS